MLEAVAGGDARGGICAYSGGAIVDVSYRVLALVGATLGVHVIRRVN